MKSYGVTIQMKPLLQYFHTVHVLFIYGHLWKAISFQIKTLRQVITYSGKPEFGIIRSLFESLWTHAYICQKPVKIVQIINKHFKTSLIYDNLRTTNLNCFARLSKANVNKSGLCTEETVNNKKNEIKYEEST